MTYATSLLLWVAMVVVRDQLGKEVGWDDAFDVANAGVLAILETM